MERPERASRPARVSSDSSSMGRPARDNVASERPSRVPNNTSSRPERVSSERANSEPVNERPVRAHSEPVSERPARARSSSQAESSNNPVRPTRRQSSNVESRTSRRVVVDDNLLVGPGERVKTRPTETVSVPENNRQKVVGARSIKQNVPKPKNSKPVKIRKQNKPKSQVEKGDMFRLILVPCILMLFFSVGMLVYHNIKNNSVTSQVEYIQGYMTGSGTINDWQGKLQCKGIEDIHWYRTNDIIEIDFGNIIMTWDYEQFITQSNLDLIKTIGFEVYYTKDKKDIRLFWSGKEVERWIK